MIELENLTENQQYDIAEFIFGHQSGTLIKPEAEALIKVFEDHRVTEAFVANLSIEDCLGLLMSNTSKETRDIIMRKYYSGAL